MPADAEGRAGAERLAPADFGIGRLFERVRDAIVLLNADTERIVLWNPAASTLFGYSAEEAIGSPVDMLVPDRLRAQHHTGLTRYRETGHGAITDADHPVEVPGRRKDGTEIPIELSLSPFDEMGLPGRYVLAILRDVTPRKMAEAAVHRSERRLEALIENVLDLLVLLDARGAIVFASRSLERVLGYLPDELLGIAVFDFIHADDQARAQADFENRIRRGGVGPLEEFRVRHRDGSWRLMEAIGKRFEDADGAEPLLLVSGRDITERRQAEEERTRLVGEQAARAEAEAGQQRFAFLAEASSVLASTQDYRETLQHVARLAVPQVADWCAVALLDDGNALQQVAAAHIDPEKEASVRAVGQFFAEGESTDRDPIRVAVRTGQSLLEAHVDKSLLRSMAARPEHFSALQEVGLTSFVITPLAARGRLLGAMICCLANPDRRPYDQSDVALIEALARRCALAVDNARLYQEAQHAIQMRDEFLSVASHDLKTPLTGVRAYAQLLRHTMGRDEAPNRALVERALQTIDEQSDKLARLIGRLLDVSRIQAGKLALEREVVDVSQLVRTFVDAMQAGAPRHTLVLHAPERLSAWIDPLRFEQVVANLVDNAIRYSPDGGPVEVRLTRPSQAELRLTVRDWGMGIHPERRAHVFERFYQAHAQGTRTGGMGLGLHIAREIVELHGGRIEVESPPNGGTMFLVTLQRGLKSEAAGDESPVDDPSVPVP